MSFSFLLRPDDEFEDEPEDELASVGMHLTEDAADDDIEDKPAGKLDEDLEIDPLVVVDVEEEKEKDPDAAPDGLQELEELEKDVLRGGLTFGDADEE